MKRLRVSFKRVGGDVPTHGNVVNQSGMTSAAGLGSTGVTRCLFNTPAPESFVLTPTASVPNQGETE